MKITRIITTLSLLGVLSFTGVSIASADASLDNYVNTATGAGLKANSTLDSIAQKYASQAASSGKLASASTIVSEVQGSSMTASGSSSVQAAGAQDVVARILKNNPGLASNSFTDVGTGSAKGANDVMYAVVITANYAPTPVIVPAPAPVVVPAPVPAPAPVPPVVTEPKPVVTEPDPVAPAPVVVPEPKPVETTKKAIPTPTVAATQTPTPIASPSASASSSPVPVAAEPRPPLTIIQTEVPKAVPYGLAGVAGLGFLGGTVSGIRMVKYRPAKNKH